MLPEATAAAAGLLGLSIVLCCSFGAAPPDDKLLRARVRRRTRALAICCVGGHRLVAREGHHGPCCFPPKHQRDTAG